MLESHYFHKAHCWGGIYSLIVIPGMDLQFEWEEMDAFLKQPDGSLFSWSERFQCYHHLIYGIVSHSIILFSQINELG